LKINECGCGKSNKREDRNWKGWGGRGRRVQWHGVVQIERELLLFPAFKLPFPPLIKY
jgi:hypothetical protein